LIAALNVESRRPAAFDSFEDFPPGHERACRSRSLVEMQARLVLQSFHCPVCDRSFPAVAPAE
jgi:hypothetical protein